MGYENDMDDYRDEQRLKKYKAEYTRKAMYSVPEGIYESESLFGLVWEVFKHRCWHLWNHGKWTD